MGVFDILTIIRVVGGIPVIAKCLLYYFYHPDVKIFFPPVGNLSPINSGGIVTSDPIFGIFGPHIINKSGKTLKLKVEFTTNKFIVENDSAKSFGYFKNRKGKRI